MVRYHAFILPKGTLLHLKSALNSSRKVVVDLEHGSGKLVDSISGNAMEWMTADNSLLRYYLSCINNW